MKIINNYKKDMIDIIKKLAYRHSVYDAFSDFLTITANDMLVLSSLAFKKMGGQLDEDKHAKRKKEIQDIRKKYYRPEETEALLQCTVILMNALTVSREDFLGQIFMELGLGNCGTGQFFTPVHIADFMAKCSLPESVEACYELTGRNYVTICDPTVGSGTLIIQACEVLRERGFCYWNYFVEGTDIDRKSAFMSYIQLSLLGIPAVIWWGDSLSMKMNDNYPTPIALLHGWLPKIYGRVNKISEVQVQEAQVKPIYHECKTDYQEDKQGQLILF